MTALVFAAFYPPFRGGYAESLHELLRRLVERGVSCRVLTANTEGAAGTETVDGVSVHRLPCWNPAWLNRTFPIPRPNRELWALLRGLRDQQWDVVMTNTRFFPTTALGAWFAWRTRTPLLHVERGSQHTIGLPWWVTWVNWIIDHTLGMLVVRRATMCVGVSEAACSFLRHLGARSVERIPNGIDTEFWSRVPPTRCAEIRRDVGLRANDLVLTSVGRLIPAKGVEDLLRVTASLVREQPNLRLLIVGGGTARHEAELRALASDLKISDHTHWLGPCPPERIRNILSITDVFVNPSHSEGLPRTVLEAASVGVPIVATDVGGTREIIRHEHSGFLYNPGNIDALQRFLTRTLQSEATRAGHARGALQHVRAQYQWSATTERYQRLLHAEVVGFFTNQSIDLVFFDVDGTLIRSAAEYYLMRRLLRRGELTARRCAAMALFFLRNLHDVPGTAIRGNKMYVGGMSQHDLVAHVDAAWHASIKPRVSPRGARIIHLLQQQRMRVVLLSAAPAVLIERLHRELGTDGFIASELSWDGGRCVGRVAGLHVYGIRKITAALRYAHEVGIPLARCGAYANAKSDEAILRMVGTPVAVNPDNSLRRVAVSYDWPILSF